MMMLALICIGLTITSFNLLALLCAAGLWFTIHPLLLLMARRDPNMIEIYRRQRQYPRHIPAFTTPFRKAQGYRIPRQGKWVP
jgi:type IV secretory pathway TrbD component